MRLERHLKVMNTKENLSEPALKVAFASSNRKQVNQHFGSANMFLVYEISEHSSNLLENLQFADEAQDGNESKLMAKLDALESCQIVYCQAIGPSAVAQLMKRGVQPMRIDEPLEISALIKSLQKQFLNPNDPLISRFIKKQDNKRFDQLAEESWEE
jgi:nitrogen fixation protein NifX